jgi:hypothetical protein
MACRLVMLSEAKHPRLWRDFQLAFEILRPAKGGAQNDIFRQPLKGGAGLNNKGVKR